jgi:adenylate cyclase
VLVGVLLGCLLAGLGVLARGSTVVEKLELALLDLRIRPASGDHAPSAGIVIMQVTDADLEAVERDLQVRWPWPLEVNASLARTLREAGARALLVDVYHLDRGAGPDDLVGRTLTTREQEEELEIEAGMAEDYAAELQKLGPVALAFELTDVATYASPPRVKAGRERLAVPGLVAPAGAPRWPAANYPVRRVTEGARALGYANMLLDADGVVRRAAPLARLGNGTVVSLPLALAYALGEAQVEDGRPRFGGRGVPLDAQGAFLIDYRAPASDRAYARVAPATVLGWARARDPQGALPPEARAAVGGKIVVYGVNVAGMTDVVPTPIDAAHDGPEVQATILDNLLHGGMRVRASRSSSGLFALLVGVLVGWGAMAPRGRLWPPLLALAVLGLAVLAAFLVFRAGVALDLFVPLAVGLLTWLAATGVRLLTEGRYNRWLEGAFARYLAPSVIEALKRDPGLLALGGTTRDVTVLFSDVAGFTKLSERLRPEQVSALLNEYLTRHCDAVFATEGVVDKFIGDAVMAFWNDPVPQPDHALRGCRTALAVQAAMPSLEPIWRGMGLPEFKVRIGLNAGTATLGNMGSRQRFDYTALGDTVNLASRLEGANKAFGTSILVGDEVRRLAGDAVLAKPLARLRVVGKEQPVEVHELVAIAADATAAQRAHVAAFTRANAAARSGDLAVARVALAEAERLAPGDGASAWLADLLARLESGAEPSPWSGTYELASK